MVLGCWVKIMLEREVGCGMGVRLYGCMNIQTITTRREEMLSFLGGE